MEEHEESVEEMDPNQLVTTTKPLVTKTKPLVTPTKLSVTPKGKLTTRKRGCQQDDQDGDEILSSDEGNDALKLWRVQEAKADQIFGRNNKEKQNELAWRILLNEPRP
ncbi:hypothetical protein GN958_ATG00213 [Phytophthora infestans]|nr:hypothetical protein GN958_ATG00213 [Phytophthora infestans]